MEVAEIRGCERLFVPNEYSVEFFDSTVTHSPISFPFVVKYLRIVHYNVIRAFVIARTEALRNIMD